MSTKIEYVDLTMNPVVGCSKCSPDCDNCYAERIAAMRVKHPNPKISGKYAGVVDEHGKWTGRLNYDLSVMDNLPKKPSRIFIGSMTDVFHENATYSEMDNIFLAMSKYPLHAFLVLTKRPERMHSYITWCCDNSRIGTPEPWPLPNLWLGVTVCNQAEADAKIPLLLQTPAAKRFVSVEPMLGPVEIGKYLHGSYECALSCGVRLPYTAPPEKQCTACGFTGPDDNATWGDGDCEQCPECGQEGCCGEIEGICPDCGTYMVREHDDTPCINWVIAGTESGPRARAADEAWFRSLRDQCRADDIKTPFFLKRNADGTRLLDGKMWNEVPL